MLKIQRAQFSDFGKSKLILKFAAMNAHLETLSVKERLHWAFEHLEGAFVLSSSFGIQSAVMLHLLVQEKPDIPVILTDTGYLFPETYRFIDELTQRFSLNLHVYRAAQTPAWQEAKYGKLWEQGVEGLERYNQMNKVDPMKRAFEQLKVGTWFSGLRRSQSGSRKSLPILHMQNGIFKFLPLVDWDQKDINDYLKMHSLPFHPLKEQGYVSVGDMHTTRKLEEGMTEEETRFFGLKRECGLHEDDMTHGGGI